MTPQSNFCRTENKRRRRGRPRGRWSAYVRRVLDGAPVEALDDALAVESQALAAALDGMWDDDWADE